MYYCDQIEEDEVDRVHSMNGRYKKCIQNFGQNVVSEETIWIT
jgi:hypothetical protein